MGVVYGYSPALFLRTVNIRDPYAYSSSTFGHTAHAKWPGQLREVTAYSKIRTDPCDRTLPQNRRRQGRTGPPGRNCTC